MQLMCDALSVLGAKHGILIYPPGRHCRLIRFDKYEELPDFGIRAGIIVGGKEIILPLARDGDIFDFCDQRMTPCTMGLMGVDPESMIKLKLTFITPFRPKDAFFSTIPALHLKLELEQLQGGFRWDTRKHYLDECEFFFEINDPLFSVRRTGDDSLDLSFTAYDRAKAEKSKQTGIFPIYEKVPVKQTDRLVVLKGKLNDRNRITMKADLKKDKKTSIEIAWCAHSDAVMNVKNDKAPFRYTKNFKNLDAVSDWVRKNPEEMEKNAGRVDGIIQKNNLGRSTNRLLSYSLHSWLLNTVWADRGGKECFTVWEGNCYFQSTVDVEFTQAPFYLAVWPELLKYELDLWPEFSKDGGKVTKTEKGKTLFVSHDIGGFRDLDGQDYPHDMEVEETANYIILSYLYWRRTGDNTSILKNFDSIEKYLEFLQACDTTGNGVPNVGVANTVDDGNPAMQFGREQVYLAVKTMAAYEAASDFYKMVKNKKRSIHFKKAAANIRAAVEKKGWLKDHYAVLLDKNGIGVVHPWTKEVLNFETLPGWDSEHIFTENAVAMMDLVGKDLGLDKDRLSTDIKTAMDHCLREYGCRHTSFVGKIENWKIGDFVFNSYDSSWISSNVVRDIAAFYRGIDMRAMADRYWEWQTTVNTREMKMYFESFNGNNVGFYPRGVAIWGYFDAIAGIVIDMVKGTDRAEPKFPQLRVPKLETADWKKGTCEIVDAETKRAIKKKTVRKTSRNRSKKKKGRK